MSMVCQPDVLKNVGRFQPGTHKGNSSERQRHPRRSFQDPGAQQTESSKHHPQALHLEVWLATVSANRYLRWTAREIQGNPRDLFFILYWIKNNFIRLRNWFRKKTHILFTLFWCLPPSKGVLINFEIHSIALVLSINLDPKVNTLQSLCNLDNLAISGE